MINTQKYRLVLVTAPDLKTARKLAHLALAQQLVACVNVIPKIESHYRWKGKLEQGSEVLLLLKTSKRQLARLEKVILENHPYETPEFIIVGIEGGNQPYLAWLESSLTHVA